MKGYQKAIIPVFIIVFGFTTNEMAWGEITFEGGVVSGKISYEGTPPEPEHFKVRKNPEFCGVERDFFHIRVKNGVLQGAAVLIEGVDGGKPMEGAEFKMVVKGCAFLPFTGVVEKLRKRKKNAPGIEIVNQDDIIHNPHPFVVRGMALRHLWIVGLPKKGAKLNKKLRVRKGNVVKIQCDQHDFMHAWLRLATNSYWTMANDKDGSYKIDGVPPGKYQLVAWHPILGEQKKEITVSDGETVEASFSFSGAGNGR